MSQNSDSRRWAGAGAAQFVTTRWSLVLTAGRRSSPDSRQALESLCGEYWYPLYAYARRRVPSADDAQDLVQEFFATLLEKNYLAVARPQRGRFRAFLLTSLKHFLANEWDKAKAQKRGGGRKPISLDFDSGEWRYGLEPADELTPERLYEKQWTLTLLDRVLWLLREEHVAVGKQEQFEHLKAFIAGAEASVSYTETACRLGISEGAAKVAAHRLRKRYRQLLRAEIAQTVAEPGDVDDEIHRLFESLRF